MRVRRGGLGGTARVGDRNPGHGLGARVGLEALGTHFLIELDWTTRIEVSRHSRKRCRDWFGWDDADDIRGEIRSAILEGRVAERAPNWTRRRLEDEQDEKIPGYHFVWNAEAIRCWVLFVRARAIDVVTLLLDHDTETEIVAERHLRTGMTRRP